MSRSDQNSLHSRRQFLQTMGSLVIALPFLPGCEPNAPAWETTLLEELPGSLRRHSQINAWLEVLENGTIRVFSGKVELGQGIRNAIRQVAAEEMYMDLEQVEVVLAETGVTPNEGYTAGSGSIQNSAMSVRYAAAAAREKILDLAQQKLQLSRDQLELDNGFVRSKSGAKRLSFAAVLEGRQIEETVPLALKLKPKSAYRYVGKAIPRADLRAMVRGEGIFIHDLTFPGMVHAKVLRPANYASKLLSFDEEALKAEAEGLLKIVRNNHFLGVITKELYQAEKVASLLEKHSQWSKPIVFPKPEALRKHIKAIATEPEIVHGQDISIDRNAATVSLKATYFKPYTMHAAMGPTCAIGRYDGEVLHIWSHSQGIYPMRAGLAAMLDMEVERIHVISAPGSGCFGHSVADDAAADVALLAMAYPNQYIRLRWSLADEQRWDPYGSAMIMEMEAGVDANGKLRYWQSNVWTDSHSTRPNKDAGTLLAARYISSPFEMKGRGYLAGGHRNADPYYEIPQKQVLAHYFDGPLRVSSLRSLGAYANIFAVESLLDELAEKTNQDAIQFRLNHLQDQRAIDVVQKVQSMIAPVQVDESEGIGFAFCRYKNYAAYCAMAAKVSVDKGSGQVKLHQFWVAIDVGEVINLDGIRNQVEGAIVQAAAWTLKEEVTFNEYEITCKDWASYEILHFEDTPDIEIAVIDRPEEAAMGGGEVATSPVAAAICNAVYRASGQRIYDLPVRLQ